MVVQDIKVTANASLDDAHEILHQTPFLIVIVTAMAMWLGGTKAADSAAPKADANLLRQAAMNNGGDSNRGKTIFFSAKAQCAPCHKVNGQGGDIGPDLSQIGGKFDRTHLIESILDPSAEILQGYQVTILETKAGRVVTGIVKSESATTVTLMDKEGKLLTVP